MANSEHAQQSRLLRLDTRDNVATAIVALPAGAVVECDGGPIRILEDVSMGHKVAVTPIEMGAKVFKIGFPIGSATRKIAPGEHVHVHNLKSDYIPTFTLEGDKDTRSR